LNNFFCGGRGPPKFFDLCYKTKDTSDRGAKFRGDRQTKLEDIKKYCKT